MDTEYRKLEASIKAIPEDDIGKRRRLAELEVEIATQRRKISEARSEGCSPDFEWGPGHMIGLYESAKLEIVGYFAEKEAREEHLTKASGLEVTAIALYADNGRAYHKIQGTVQVPWHAAPIEWRKHWRSEAHRMLDEHVN